MTTQDATPKRRDAAHIFYHANCCDGFGAYFVAHGALSGLRDEPIGQPLDYNTIIHVENPFPEIPDGAEVFFLDFCFNRHQRPILYALARRCSRVVVIDHHATGEWITTDAPEGVEVVFDKSKSGAVLAWEYFYPARPIPLLLQYIQDRDLWQHKLPDTQAVNLAIKYRPRTLEAWRSLTWDMRGEVALGSVIMEGLSLARYRDALVEQIVATTRSHPIGSQGAFFVWFFCVPDLASDACHAALKACPEALFAAAFTVDKMCVNVSLRSRVDGGCDVGQLAQALGGGGHPAASGFSRLVGIFAGGALDNLPYIIATACYEMNASALDGAPSQEEAKP